MRISSGVSQGVHASADTIFIRKKSAHLVYNVFIFQLFVVCNSLFNAWRHSEFLSCRFCCNQWTMLRFFAHI